MRTDDLIQSLAADSRPVSRHAVERRVALGTAMGILAAVVLLFGYFGLRSDIHQAMFGFSFWMKAFYTASLAVISLAAVVHVARPDAGRATWLWLLVLPVVVIAMLSMHEFMTVPRNKWMPMWLGHSWRQCSTSVILLSLPVFLGLLWAFRTLAPTRLRLAGAIAGLAAGATGATVYGLHCGEVMATFVLTWYTLGMAASAALGALIGPRLLRW